jgi:hypothetical protein
MTTAVNAKLTQSNESCRQRNIIIQFSVMLVYMVGPLLSRSKMGSRPIEPFGTDQHDDDVCGGVPLKMPPGGEPGELAPDENMLPMPLSLAMDDDFCC